MSDVLPESQQTVAQPTAPRWKAISATDRRVLGVLVEKAKTTPDGYPMSINAICTASNQKSNRHPLMQLSPDDVEESLERLRALGAAAEVQAGGRVLRYRHYLYDWLGVDKVELAVMAELLLRGAQTEGELRGRAARMEPINDLSALHPVLDSLKAKGLVVPLTPDGRGHVVTHALYLPNELERLRAEHSSTARPRPLDPPELEPDRATASSPRAAPGSPAPSQTAMHPGIPAGMIGQGRHDSERELSELRSLVSQLRQDFDALTAEVERQSSELSQLKDALM